VVRDGLIPMAERFAIGDDGWIEVNRDVRSAAFQVSGQEGVSIDEALAGLLTGEYSPAEYGLVSDDESGDEADESDDE